MIRTPIRHGDVMLVPVGSVPDGATERVTSCIVGRSQSGHHHVLDSDLEFATTVSASGTLYVDLDGPTRLVRPTNHDGHRELEVPAGTWRVVRRPVVD